METMWQLLRPWKYPQSNTEADPQLELKIKFQAYQEKFGKQYADKEEHEYRMELFNEVDQFIESWNVQPNRTHIVGHNEFSDWSYDERSKLRGLSRDRDVKVDETQPMDPSDI